MIKIIVNTEKEKEDLLAASRYIHDLRCIDTNHNDMVNTVCHIHMAPFLIEVDPDLPRSWG